MAESSGFFTSKNGDRKYNERNVAKIVNSLVTDGVYYNRLNALKVVPEGENRNVVLRSGRLNLNEGSWYENDSDLVFASPVADGALSRYDTVIIRYSAASREAKAYYLVGEFSLSPEKYIPIRNIEFDERVLAYIYVEAGQVSVTEADIEDTRLSEELCGTATGWDNQINASEFYSQLNSEVEKLKKEVEQVRDGSAYMLKTQYDPEFGGIGITTQEFTHTALGEISGVGTNGYFVAGYSGTVSQIQSGEDVLEVRSGEDQEIEFIAGILYSFIVVGNTINFKTGGGSASLKVIASIDKENLPVISKSAIGIISDTQPRFYFLTDEFEILNTRPSGEPWQNGDIYVSSENPLLLANILNSSKGIASQNLGATYQLQNGVWNRIDAYWNNEQKEWEQFSIKRLELYKEGVFSSLYPSNKLMTFYAPSAGIQNNPLGTYTLNSDSFTLNVSSNDREAGTVISTVPIDLTAFKTMYIDTQLTVGGTYLRYTWFGFIKSYNGTQDILTNSTFTRIGAASYPRQIITIDVSDLIGEYYFHISAYSAGTNPHVTQVWNLYLE